MTIWHKYFNTGSKHSINGNEGTNTELILIQYLKKNLIQTADVAMFETVKT